MLLISVILTILVNIIRRLFLSAEEAQWASQ
jgi:hypothetical protein